MTGLQLWVYVVIAAIVVTVVIVTVAIVVVVIKCGKKSKVAPSQPQHRSVRRPTVVVVGGMRNGE